VARNVTVRPSALWLLLAAVLGPACGFAVTNTAVTLTVSAFPAASPQIAQPVTLGAQVTPTSPSWPRGTIDFLNGTAAIDGCTGVPIQTVLNPGPEAIAYCNTSFAQLGSFTITAQYSGDTYTSSSTGSLGIAVGKVAPAAYIASNPVVPARTALPYGEAVILGATFPPAAGVAAPTGTVTFYDGSATLATEPINAAGHAGMLVAAFSVGTHNIHASYTGDNNYQASTTQTLVISVIPASVLLTPSWTVFQPGKPITLYITPTVISPGDATPSGTVTFSAGSTAIAACTALPLVNGTAQCTTTLPGTTTFSVSYSGDTDTAAVATISYQLVTGKALPGMYAGCGSGSAVLGAPVTVNAQVAGAPGLAAPTGTVTFTDNSVALATLPLAGDGRVSLVMPSGSLAALTLGTHDLRATYSGDAIYESSTVDSPVLVSAVPTMVTVSSTAAFAGSPITLTAVVTVVSPGNATPTGTVDFQNGNTAIPGCTGLPLTGGMAQCTTTFSASASFNVAYSGDANTASSAAAVKPAAGKPLAGIYATPASSSSATPPFGTPVGVTAVLIAAAGGPIPGGTVTFADGGSTVATAVADSGGHATAELDGLNVGDHEIVAVYGGDATYPAATAAALSIVVGKAVTEMDLAATPAQAGQPVTLKAAVTVLGPGTGAPAGTVDFSNGSNPIAGCTGVAVQSGVAQCTTAFAQIGTYTINANYSGGTNITAATASMQLTVGKAVAGCTSVGCGFFISAYSTSLPYGAGVGLRGLLIGTPTPTGTVTFSDGGATLATVAVGPDGTAPLAVPSGSLPPLRVGSHSITGVYSGDSNYQPATAPPLTLAITKASVAVALASTPPQLDQPVTLKAAVTVVSPGVATPAGTVDFINGSTSIAGCTGMLPQSGVVYCNTTVAQLGAFVITARYNGDADTAPGTAVLQLNAARAVAGIYTASAPAAPVFGVPVTVSALLLGANGVAPPSGTVSFYDGAALAGVAKVGTDGRASLSLRSGVLAVGQHTFLASYSGDGNYASVTASPMTVTVGKAGTATALSASFGMPFTATVSVLAPGAGLPTGTVQFFVGGAPAGTVSLVEQNGVATASLAAGSWAGSISAVYQGDADFSGSASAAASVAAGATVSISSDHNPAAVGQTVNFTVTVAPASGTVAPGGRVTVTVDGAPLGSAALISGQASFAAGSTALAAGSHTVTASYSGDSIYPAVSGTLVEVVSKTILTLTISSNLASAVYGQALTFTAQLSPVGSGPAPSGTVQFSDGAAVIGSAPLVSGAAVLTLTNLTAGNHSISAILAGDAGSGAAASTPLALVVNKAQTTTLVASGGLMLTALAAAVAPGAGTPTGTVTFVDKSTSSVFATVALSAGVASTPQPRTSDPIVAAYSGDANFASSASTELSPLAAVNAASFASDRFAADQIVSLFGSALSVATASGVSNPAASLGGTSVSVTDSAGVRRAANLLFVSPSQANIVMPSATAAGPAVLALTNAAGATLATAVTVTPVAPGLFTVDGSGAGLPVGQVIRAHADGTQDAPEDITTTPIDLGQPADSVYLVLYGTGIRHQSTATATFACAACTAGDVPLAYAGAQPSVAGLDQVNLLVPFSLRGAGSVTFTVVTDGARSNTVTLAFQ